jgi:hypothetical protein
MLNIDDFITGFTPIFGGFLLTGLTLIITLNVVLMVQQNKTNVLPMQHQDLAVGSTTAIMLSKRYMSIREPPLTPVPTPQSQGLKGPFEGFRPSSPDSEPSLELQLPRELEEGP